MQLWQVVLLLIQGLNPAQGSISFMALTNSASPDPWLDEPPSNEVNRDIQRPKHACTKVQNFRGTVCSVSNQV